MPTNRPTKTPAKRIKRGPYELAEESPGKDVNARLGVRLRQLRIERNLRQQDVATRFGIQREYLSRLESGKHNVSLAMLEVLALGFRLSLSDLLKGL